MYLLNSLRSFTLYPDAGRETADVANITKLKVTKNSLKISFIIKLFSI
jgi:hypothetical protein